MCCCLSSVVFYENDSNITSNASRLNIQNGNERFRKNPKCKFFILLAWWCAHFSMRSTFFVTLFAQHFWTSWHCLCVHGLEFVLAGGGARNELKFFFFSVLQKYMHSKTKINFKNIRNEKRTHAINREMTKTLLTTRHGWIFHGQRKTTI